MENFSQPENGMLTGKRIFFYDKKRFTLIDKIKRILIRLGAEVVEQFDGNNIHLVIFEAESLDLPGSRKRKILSPLNYPSKTARHDKLVKSINNMHHSMEYDTQNNALSNHNSLEKFLNFAKEKGAKSKTVDDVWKFILKYYSILIEYDDPEDSPDVLHSSRPLDKMQRVRHLSGVCLKVVDITQKTRPIVLQNFEIEKQLWSEFQNVDLEKRPSGSSRTSIGTSRKSLIPQQGGHCEACNENYLKLEQHLISDKHQKFAKNNFNFAGIDKFCDSIDDFFTSRVQLWERHKRPKVPCTQLTRLSLTQQPKSMTAVASQKPVLNPQILLAQSPKSSASSTSSSGSSDDSSSYDSSSGSERSCIISSTPRMQKLLPKLDFFSPESISAEDGQQNQISLHVDDVINNIIIDGDDVSSHIDWLPNNIDIVDEDPHSSLRRPSRPIVRSPILTPRFLWCPQCSRNHVPIGYFDDNGPCPFLHDNKVESQSVDVIDLTDMISNHCIDGHSVDNEIRFESIILDDDAENPIDDNIDKTSIYSNISHSIDINCEINNSKLSTNVDLVELSNISNTIDSNVQSDLSNRSTDNIKENIDLNLINVHNEMIHNFSASHICDDGFNQSKSSMATNKIKGNIDLQSSIIDEISTNVNVKDSSNISNVQSDRSITANENTEHSSLKSSNIFDRSSPELNINDNKDWKYSPFCNAINMEYDSLIKNDGTNPSIDNDMDAILPIIPNPSNVDLIISDKIQPNVSTRIDIEKSPHDRSIMIQYPSPPPSSLSIDTQSPPKAVPSCGKIHKKSLIDDVSKENLPSPSRPRRLAAESARRGIFNTNRFFDSNIQTSYQTMVDSYEPNQFDKRLIMLHAQFSQTSPSTRSKTSDQALHDRNL